MPLLLLLGLIGAAFFFVRGPREKQTPSVGLKMASWVVRVLFFLAISLGLFLLILLPLPNKHRILALVPIFFVGSFVYKVLRASGRKIQRPEPDLEQMKRVPRKD
jgi:hypothetical protein